MQAISIVEITEQRRLLRVTHSEPNFTTAMKSVVNNSRLSNNVIYILKSFLKFFRFCCFHSQKMNSEQSYCRVRKGRDRERDIKPPRRLWYMSHAPNISQTPQTPNSCPNEEQKIVNLQSGTQIKIKKVIKLKKLVGRVCMTRRKKLHWLT